jgi:protein TonB
LPEQPPAAAQPVSTPAQPAPPKQPAPPAAPAPAPTPPAPQLIFNLGGTDAETSQLVTGDFIPAKPDSRFPNRAPIFPEAAAMRGEHGTVTLMMHVATNGVPELVELVRSSGYPDLDQAAVKAVQKWHLSPAIRDGKPVTDDVTLNFEFLPY